MPSDAYNTSFDADVNSMTSKRRVLFFAEPATLAHVVRPVVLAGALDREYYEIAVATGKDFRHHVEAAGLPVIDLWCIGTRAYLAAVAAGRPVYSYPVLERYVEDDLRVIAEFRPDLIVGDFRLSLAVSARKAQIPYIAISNAYWSPYAQPKFEVPVHAATRILGFRAANFGFNLLRPLIFAQHSLPMHRLRRRHGMPSLGFDLRNVFTEADLTLFADVPEMVPTLPGASENRYRYIGPSHMVAVNRRARSPCERRGLAATGLRRAGSSGDESTLDDIVDAVVESGCRAVVSADPDRFPMTQGDERRRRSYAAGAGDGSARESGDLQRRQPERAPGAATGHAGNRHSVKSRSTAEYALRRAFGCRPIPAGRSNFAAALARRCSRCCATSFPAAGRGTRAWFGRYPSDQRFVDALSALSTHQFCRR